MTKREAAKEQRKSSEIAAIERELHLIAAGAYGGANVEDDPESGVFLFGTMGVYAWSRYLDAIWALWGIGSKVQGSGGEYTRGWTIQKTYNLPNFESLAKSAKFLYEHGARAGGRWVE